MAKSFVITAKNNLEFFNSIEFIDGAETYSIDFSPWVDDNNTISTITWTLKSGQVTISSKSLNDNVASALLTFSQSGGNLIQIKADSGTEIYIAYLSVFAKDLSNTFTDDYGMVFV